MYIFPYQTVYTIDFCYIAFVCYINYYLPSYLTWYITLEPCLELGRYYVTLFASITIFYVI